MLQPLRAGAGAANVMPDDKSSDEFFMKNREKGKKEGRKEGRKNVAVVVLFAIKITREILKRYRCNWTSNCRQVLLLAGSLHELIEPRFVSNAFYPKFIVNLAFSDITSQLPISPD